MVIKIRPVLIICMGFIFLGLFCLFIYNNLFVEYLNSLLLIKNIVKAILLFILFGVTITYVFIYDEIRFSLSFLFITKVFFLKDIIGVSQTSAFGIYILELTNNRKLITFLPVRRNKIIMFCSYILKANPLCSISLKK